MSNEANDSVMDKYNELLKGFASKLNDRVIDIENAENDLVENGYSYERIELLHRLVHSLTGTSAMFGLTKVSESSFHAEVYLKPFAKENKPFNSTEDIVEIKSRLIKLKETIAQQIAE